MRKALLELFENTGDLEFEAILLRMVVATVIAFFIFLSYKISHEGTIYSKKFNVSLMVLTVITTAVMIVIGNNIALSLGMVGALSIVRFRTAIKDSRDTVYIFWTTFWWRQWAVRLHFSCCCCSDGSKTTIVCC